MFAHGVDKTLSSYQIDYKEAFDICDSGSVLISKWTSRIKNTISSFEKNCCPLEIYDQFYNQINNNCSIRMLYDRFTEKRVHNDVTLTSLFKKMERRDQHI